TLRVRRLTATATVPAYQTAGAHGLDLHADLPGGPLVVAPGERVVIDTGIAVAIPPGFQGKVRARSGLAARLGVVVLGGEIDADYRGTVRVIALVTGREEWRIAPGDRIAQLVVAPVASVRVVEVSHLDDTERGAAGFGSTGTGVVEDRPADALALVADVLLADQTFDLTVGSTGVGTPPEAA